MKGSLIILSLFIIGIFLGIADIIPDAIDLDLISKIALLSLLFLVGITIGHDPKTIKKFSQLSPRLLLLPVMTVVGTYIGTAIASLFVGRTLLESLAVGSGFAYYSLSSVIISDTKGLELGTVALIANILREITVLIGTPLLIKCFGKLAPISVGGATSMDTTLPFIKQYCGEQYIMIAIFHGFIINFIAPFLVTFFCTL